MSISHSAAIVGIGATEFSQRSGRSTLRLATECITTALADARIDPAEVDGLVTFTMDHNDEQDVARYLGLPSVRFFARTPYGGGGACGTVGLAALAIHGGAADVVVCYRAMNERSEERFGTAAARGYSGGPIASWQLDMSWSEPFGMATPGAHIALAVRRYMYETGATSEDFGRISVLARKHAATNPAARFYGKPISLADHQSSRLIVDPLRLFDFCLESDGGVALVITSQARARRLRQPVVAITAASQGIGHCSSGLASHYRKDPTTPQEIAVVGNTLWKDSRLGHSDIDLAILYDHFSATVLMQLEALGFCDRGHAAGFVRDGGIELGARLPVNTHGGQIGEAYIHGFNGIAEAVRQLRGTAVNQVSNPEHAIVTSGSHVPTSGLILSRL